MSENNETNIDEKAKSDLIKSVDATGSAMYILIASIIIIIGIIVAVKGLMTPIINITFVICGGSLLVLSVFIFAIAKLIKIKTAIFFKLDEISKKLDK